ncbi:MAG: biopolymer transporter ExbD [Elusimicrobia bacterium]|nr:biopolymer transporter ExbD [Candidatus Obscuribacterium magneticum]
MKAGTSQGSGRYHILADINMIPLIDVALVLLIIFMVISPILVESQLRVNLPKVTSSTKTEETALKVEIAADGSIAFRGRIVHRNNLKNIMAREIQPGTRTSLLIQADRDVAFDTVVFVMDVAKQLNVDKLGVAVIPQVVNP